MLQNCFLKSEILKMAEKLEIVFLFLTCSLLGTVSVTPAKFPCHAQYLDIEGNKECYVNLTGMVSL